MTRARPVDALLAALATVAVLLPLRTLFDPDSFLWPAIAVILVVGLVGVAARTLLTARWPVVVVQAVAALLTAVALHGRGHLWHGLPTPEMFAVWNKVLADAIATIQNYSAPAPSTRGVIVGITLGAGAAAILVDALSVTYRAPAVAGLPLLTAYLVSAANSGVGLSAVYFVIAASVWVLMVGRQGVASFRRWGMPMPLDTPERRLADEALSLRYTSAGRRLAVGCLALAVIVPMALPHLPARFLLNGLGRNPDGVGVGNSMRLSSSLDVSRSLRSQSQGAVLRFRSDAAVTEPLRVDVLTDYSGGRWTSPDSTTFGDRLPNPPEGMTDDVTRSVARISVTDNSIDAPQLAAPFPAVGVSMGRTQWATTAAGTIRTDRRPSSYRIDYLKLSPTETQLRASTVQTIDYGGIDPAYLDVDAGSLNVVNRTVDRLVPRDADAITTARAIQNYLRGPGFTYSLRVPPLTAADQGNPLRAFLRAKQGYCVQFATAMIMMARSRGIPARMAIGFLPGHLQADGSYLVRASDAHAWPELYFSGIGWLRFDPTPGSRSGSAPIYSSAPLPSDDGTTATGATDTSSASASTAPRTVENQQDNAGGVAPHTAPPLRLWQTVQSLPAWVWFVVVLILGALSTLVVPAAAAVRRRRELAAAADDAERVEVQWQELMARIGDLGVRPPPGATPRQAGRFVSVSAHLPRDDVDVLKSVVATVETARYAVPGTPVESVAEPARQVVDAVGRSRTRLERLRAWLLPSDGRDHLRSLGRRVVEVPRNAVARLRAPRPPDPPRDPR